MFIGEMLIRAQPVLLLHILYKPSLSPKLLLRLEISSKSFLRKGFFAHVTPLDTEGGELWNVSF